MPHAKSPTTSQTSRFVRLLQDLLHLEERLIPFYVPLVLLCTLWIVRYPNFLPRISLCKSSSKSCADFSLKPIAKPSRGNSYTCTLCETFGLYKNLDDTTITRRPAATQRHAILWRAVQVLPLSIELISSFGN